MKLKRLGALAAALVFALSALCGCGGQSGGGASSSAGGSSQTPAMDLSQITDPYLAVSGLAADEVVITVGSVEITAAHYLYWLNRAISSYLSQSGAAAPAPDWDTETEEGLTIGRHMLDQAEELAVFHGMLRQTAQAEGISPDPSIASDTNDRYVNLILQSGGDESLVTHVFWASMLTKELSVELNADSGLFSQLRELYYGEDSGHYPTDAEVNAYLDENGYFRVKHILLKTTDQAGKPLDESSVSLQKTIADSLLSELRASEDPITLFDQLMNKHSEDGGLSGAPDGYIFDAGSSLVGGFREAALALTVGEISDVVETDVGYHIMLRLPIDPAGYRDEYASSLLNSRINAERDRLGVTRTAAFSKLDVASFWNNMLSLQTAVQAERAG